VPLLRQALAAGKAYGTRHARVRLARGARRLDEVERTMLGGGTLLPEYRDTWAQYIVKFVQAYEKAGIPLWGLSVQNEPMAKQTWESMIYTAEDETRFLGDHLGPR
jgi:glucosylceramidase